MGSFGKLGFPSTKFKAPKNKQIRNSKSEMTETEDLGSGNPISDLGYLVFKERRFGVCGEPIAVTYM
jgi:hypothetical protein